MAATKEEATEGAEGGEEVENVPANISMAHLENEFLDIDDNQKSEESSSEEESEREADEILHVSLVLNEMIEDVIKIHETAGGSDWTADFRLLKSLPHPVQQGLKFSYRHFEKEGYPHVFSQPLPPAVIKDIYEERGDEVDFLEIRKVCLKLIDKLRKAINDLNDQIVKEQGLIGVPENAEKARQMQLGKNMFLGALSCYVGFVAALDQFVKADKAYNKIRQIFSGTGTLLMSVVLSFPRR